MINSEEQKSTEENEQSLHTLWRNIKQSNICVIRVPKRDEKNNGTEKYLKKSWLIMPQIGLKT